MKNIALVLVSSLALSASAQQIEHAVSSAEGLATKARMADQVVVERYAGQPNAYLVYGCDRNSNSRRRTILMKMRETLRTHGAPATANIHSVLIATPAYEDGPTAGAALARFLSDRDVDGPTAGDAAIQLALREPAAPAADAGLIGVIQTLGAQGRVVFFTYNSCGAAMPRR